MGFFSMVTGLVATVAAVAGVVFLCLGMPGWLLACAIVTLVDSAVQVLFGGQNNFATETLMLFVGLIISAFGVPFLVAASAALCIETIIATIFGYAYALFCWHRHKG